MHLNITEHSQFQVCLDQLQQQYVGQQSQFINCQDAFPLNF